MKMTTLRSATLCLFILFASLLLSACQPSTNEKKVGILIPIEHQSLNEIIAGFETSLRTHYKGTLKIKVANAQGDINLQRAIIQKMRDEKYDLIVPIGTDASQLTVATIKKQPILSLAASLTQQDRDNQSPCRLAIVHDEIAIEKQLAFIHAVYPEISRLVLIHSASEKVFTEVKAATLAGQRVGIKIKAMMAPTLNDLYSLTQQLPTDTQGVFVLKDSLIVSGISTLKQATTKRHIPLMTSDQGSVQEGAAFALGVYEREIGAEGAKLASDILAGQSACQLPIVEMTRLTVFVNQETMINQSLSLDSLLAAAKKQQYTVELIQSGKGA